MYTATIGRRAALVSLETLETDVVARNRGAGGNGGAVDANPRRGYRNGIDERGVGFLYPSS